MSTTTELTNEASLADLAERINAEHEACLATMRKSLIHALTAGELLLQAKGGLPHGQWLPWLEGNCPEISERSAQRYMRLAEYRDVLDAESATVADFREAFGGA